LRKQREWEERDTDEAVKIFKKEKGEKKLIKIKSLAEIHGKYRDYWAFSIDNSYRIMFRFLDATKSVAAFINVGTHEIYK
jgi:mRNA-degrading endonuclease YafQ of YafQ-DinJ toxin-antitoxin module